MHVKINISKFEPVYYIGDKKNIFDLVHGVLYYASNYDFGYTADQIGIEGGNFVNIYDSTGRYIAGMSMETIFYHNVIIPLRLRRDNIIDEILNIDE